MGTNLTNLNEGGYPQPPSWHQGAKKSRTNFFPATTRQPLATPRDTLHATTENFVAMNLGRDENFSQNEMKEVGSADGPAGSAERSSGEEGLGGQRRCTWQMDGLGRGVGWSMGAIGQRGVGWQRRLGGRGGWASRIKC